MNTYVNYELDPGLNMDKTLVPQLILYVPLPSKILPGPDLSISAVVAGVEDPSEVLNTSCGLCWSNLAHDDINTINVIVTGYIETVIYNFYI